MMGALSKRPPERRHHIKCVEERGKLRSLLFRESSYITVAQYFRRACARRGEIVCGCFPSSRLRFQ
jgi:hypothetical protein